MRTSIGAALAILALNPAVCLADTAEAACQIYPAGEDHADVTIPCTFSQRQGYITIHRSDGVVHELSPSDDSPGNYSDERGRPVYRQSDLDDQGLIFRFPDESVYLYWNTAQLAQRDESNPTWPFSTDDYDATTLLRCRAAGADHFVNCPAGILRLEGGRAAIVVQNPAGEQFTINFMSDYIAASNRSPTGRLVGDTWLLKFSNGEVWQVPLAVIEGD
jgi:hypothetical protein